MITYRDVEDLLDIHTKNQPILSFYLNCDRARFPLDQLQVAVRNLLREGRKSAEAGLWPDSIKQAVRADLERVEKYLHDELGPGFPHRGLAIFACGEADLWRIFFLPRPLPTGLTLEFTARIRPLTLILDQFHRYGVLLLDSRAAELYEVYMGEILCVSEAFEVGAPTPILTPTAEGPGSGDRGISRRGEEGMQKHFRRIADILLHQYHRRHYEFVILGGQQSLLVQFENFLHPQLKEHLVGRFPAEPNRTKPPQVLKEVMAIESRVEAEMDEQLVRQLIDAAQARGLAVLGLDDVLLALSQGAVHQLMVEQGWRKAGVLCRHCGFIGVHGDSCPGCSSPLDRVSDVVDEAIEAALRTGSIIEHVHPAAGLSEQGHIGAFLRFKVV